MFDYDGSERPYNDYAARNHYIIQSFAETFSVYSVKPFYMLFEFSYMLLSSALSLFSISGNG